MATTLKKRKIENIPVADEIELRCDHFRYRMFGKIIRVAKDNLMEYRCKACSKFYSKHFKAPHVTFHYYNMAGELVETITQPVEVQDNKQTNKNEKKEDDKINVNTNKDR